MKASEIRTGRYYTARVSRQIVTVRVDQIGTRDKYRRGTFGNPPTVHTTTSYHVTNMATDRKLVFKTAQKFRQPTTEPIDAGQPAEGTI